jgi:hypothetical protein
VLRSIDGLTTERAGLDELRDQSSVYDDLHVEARRVLDRNPEPRNLRDVTVALESMGYTATGAEALGFDSVFDLATAVYELTYLYYVPQVHAVPEPMGAWRRFTDDYLAGSWYGVPWIMSVIVLFFGRVALWSSLDSTPQSEAMVSMAFFLAAVLAGGCSQMIGRKGTFYLLQKNYPLVRWTVTRFVVYSGSLAALVIALAYTFYVVPYYGLHLGELFAEYAAAIFIFLLSAAPLYMLRRFYTLALATGLALAVTLVTARLITTDSPGFRHAQLLGIAVVAGAMVVIVASCLAMRSETGPGGSDPDDVIKPPELRVILWYTAPYAVYGMAYFVMILVSPMIVGFAYGHSLGVDQYVYPSTFEGSVDLALLDLVVLLGLVYASIERFGRRLRPLLENQALNSWRQARATLRREWVVAVSVLAAASGLVAWLLPKILLALLPAGLTASVRTPGGLSVLEVASFGFAVVPIGMLCSQYLFFLSKPRWAVGGAVAGACTTTVVTVLLVHSGSLTNASWGLLAGSTVYALITGLASFRVLSAGEESFYGSF